MADSNSDLLVSVAKVIARDVDTGEGLFYGLTEINTSFTTSMTTTEARGGVGNQLIGVYMHDKKIEMKVDQATLSMALLGFNAGQLPTAGTYNILQTETITLVSGVGSVSLTPLSDIAVYLADGSIQNVTPTTKSFTVTNGASQTVQAVYTAAVAAEQIVINAVTPPKTLDITLIAEIRNAGTLTNYLHINIPRYQTDGANTLAMAANGISQFSLSGFAVVFTDTDGSQIYGKIWKVPASAASVAVTEIVALPSTLVFSGSGVSMNIKTLAVKGTTGNQDITTSASYTTTASWTAGLHTGVCVSGSGTISGQTASCTVSYYDAISGSTFYDYVNLLRE
jgi:hypothetical protein